MSMRCLLPAAAAVSFLLTWAVMRFARKRRLLDFPNERSSHDYPVPRIGGIAIVLTSMSGLVAADWAGTPDDRLLAVVLGGGGLVALVGLLDDYRDVGVSWRLISQAVAAGWALYWLGGLPESLLPGVPMVPAIVLGTVCIVWLINLYNFMDGIDGIAAIETVTVCLGGIVLYAFGITADGPWVPPAMLLAVASGFLMWNFPRARIFLGDAGSGFLGFMMAVFCVQAAQVEPALFWGWIILLGVFIVDSGVTLARRTLRRQHLYEAHRSHAYQYAARKHGGHARVSLAVGLINLVWLLPMALVVAAGRSPALPVIVVAYVPLVWLAFHFKAGASDQQDV